MIQQINLYQPLFRRQKKVFSASAMLLVTGIVLAALILIYGFAQWQLHLLAERYQNLQAQEQQITQRLMEISTQWTGQRGVEPLKADVQQLENRLQARRRAMAGLSGHAAGNTQGFSAQLAGLARQVIDGLWLTAVTLDAGGEQVSLTGRTTAPALLPKYVQKLGAEPAFNGLRFEGLRIYRLEDTNRYVGFQLASDVEKLNTEEKAP
ncbi:MAG TPA: PilN domain-containing protein [Gammaproteobacteria bacterium]|nr:PilN domain-containing protein [Gammaproteobacteria bacterium]